MLVGQQSRPGSALWALCLGAIVLAAPAAVSANPLDEQACQRLRTERQALTVLGIDKHVEKGAGWAKERLTPADLNLVKRYLDVFEQIKFRCDKIVAMAEPEEKEEDDDDGNAAGGAAPPMPERKSVQPVKSSAAPAVVPQTKSNSAAKTGKAPFGSANASAIQAGPVGVAPAR
jgi:hypothetical protein